VAHVAQTVADTAQIEATAAHLALATDSRVAAELEAVVTNTAMTEATLSLPPHKATRRPAPKLFKRALETNALAPAAAVVIFHLLHAKVVSHAVNALNAAKIS
jgi:hypothetical protein